MLAVHHRLSRERQPVGCREVAADGGTEPDPGAV